MVVGVAVTFAALTTAAVACSWWVPRRALFEIGLGCWPLWRVPGGVALTFDDGPDPRFTPKLLDALRAFHTTVTFFVSTSLAVRHPSIVRRAHAEGHAIGCHAMTHTPLAFRSRETLHRQVSDAVRGLEDVLGDSVSLFRPPYGIRSPGLHRILRSEGLRPVYWSVMAFDWRVRSSKAIAERVLRGARPGAIVLLHDGGGDRSATVEAVPVVLDTLRGGGIPCVRLNGGERRDEFAMPA
ncbi:polysaccharide deacetylase family protein [Candidatus Fermentibacteria bacterium]|nr:polysaccharide deacetylase family protein [Candidatus Fermentibacteria bacterium]